MSNKVYGYKGMDKNMTCRGMKFAVGNHYHVHGHIDVCRNGLHFCERLTDVFGYYQRDGNRFFLVIASGTIRKDGDKSAASDLEIVRELSDIEINKIVYECGYGFDGYCHGYGRGDGNGNGYGDGNGNGYGDGTGYGNGYGNGNGYGDGNGYGNGYGDGNGYGNGYGDGNGNGNGDGDANSNIQKILLFL